MKAKKKRIARVHYHRMCPACLDRDAVNLIGRPRFVRGSRMTGGCELCDGRGEVTLGWCRGEEIYEPWVVRVLAA